MTWHDGDLLWMLILVPIFAGLLLFAARRRDARTKRFGQRQRLEKLMVGRGGPWRVARGILWLLALSGILVALAGPLYGSRTRVLRKRGVDVVIVLDFSKSMLARDVRPNRIDRAKAEIMRLVEELDGDRVGLVAFAGETIEFPMTVDYAALQLFLRDLGPYDLPVGGTAIGRALNSAQRLLERSHRGSEETARPSRVVILMTDGEDHEGDPREVATELAEAGTRVYTIGIGSTTGEPIPTYARDGTWTGYLRDPEGELVTTSLTAENEATLEAVADATGGRYFRARAGSVGVDQIRSEMRRMRQEERQARRVTVHENRFALLLLPAFLLFLLESLLPIAWVGRRRKTLPEVPERRARASETVKKEAA